MRAIVLCRASDSHLGHYNAIGIRWSAIELLSALPMSALVSEKSMTPQWPEWVDENRGRILLADPATLEVPQWLDVPCDAVNRRSA
jgi:hypothetical protein